MTETFLSKVISIDEETELITIQPLIVNVDGQDHVELSAKTLNGQEVNVDDIVIIETSKNDLDGESISDYEKESRTNCIIVGVFTAQDGYKLKGLYTITGDLIISENFTVGEGLERIVLGEKLSTELNKLIDLWAAVLSVMSGPVINEPGAGNPSALQAAFAVAVTGKPNASAADILSEKSKTD